MHGPSVTWAASESAKLWQNCAELRYTEELSGGVRMADLASSSTQGFRVHCYESDVALVAECHGRLTFENAAAFKEALRGRLATHQRLVIDLKEVPQIDSSGLGAIAGLYVSTRTRGCRMEVVNANQPIRDLFSITNILSLFEQAGRYHGKTL